VLDSYLKFRYFKDDLAQARSIAGHNVLLEIDRIPDFSQTSFSLVKTVRWGALLPLSLIVILVLTWLLYFTLYEDNMHRKKIVHVEVKSREEEISRTHSKENLNAIIEV
jgi:hypothetical protein